MTNKAGPLDALEALPLLGPDTVASFGATVVVAPHCDDESLGCGGLIALLHRAEQTVNVIVISDGAASHPHSRAFPPEARRDLREGEAQVAVTELGLSPACVSFMRLPDSRVPGPGQEEFEDAVSACVTLLLGLNPSTVLVPWRRDPHSDHRATWHIVQAAISHMQTPCRVIEYPIWVWDMGKDCDYPEAGEMHGWRLDIAGVLDQKLAAIAAHRSQTTDLIYDDPDGFRLTPDTLAHFQRRWEVFLEPKDA